MEMTIGKPEHGWVDVAVVDGKFTLHDSISDVPCDFIGHSVLALSRLLTHETVQEIALSLEPGYYVFKLSRDGQTFALEIRLTVSQRRHKVLHRAAGTFDEIILPIYLAIKEFYSQEYREPHWPEGSEINYKNLVDTVTQYQSSMG